MEEEEEAEVGGGFMAVAVGQQQQHRIHSPQKGGFPNILVAEKRGT